MDVIDSGIFLWKQFQQPGWEVKLASHAKSVIFEVPTQAIAEELIDAATSHLAASAVMCKCDAAVVRFPGCGNLFYSIPSAMAEEQTPLEEKVREMTKVPLNNDLLGADYIRIHEFLLEQRKEGNIVIITSNITRDESGRLVSTDNPSAGRDICHHTNDLLLPNRAFWSANQFTGYNYRLSWRSDFNDFEHLNPQYIRLKELLEQDGYVQNYEYTLFRPDGALCSYSTTYFLCRDYLGDEVRIGVSRPRDWRLLVEPELAVSST